jgi:hypothetical protein
MKKALVVFLILAVAGGVFAQGLKLSGLFHTGLAAVLSNKQTGPDETLDPYIFAWTRDSEQKAFRFRLNGAWENEGGNAGGSFRLQIQGGDREPFFDWGYGWIKAFDKKLWVLAGIIDNGTFNSGGGILDSDAGEGLGSLVIVSPISGLDLGVGVYVGDKKTVTGDVYNSAGTDVIYEGIPYEQFVIYQQNKLWYPKYTFSINYKMPDLFQATVSFRTHSKYADGNPGTPLNDFNYGFGQSSQAIISARYLGLPALTRAVVEAQLDNLEHYGSAGLTNIFVSVAYKVNSDLEVGLNGGYYMQNVPDGADKLDPIIAGWLWGEYKLSGGTIVPRLDASYTIGTEGTTDFRYMRKFFLEGKKYNNDYSVLGIRPSVAFNVDSASVIEVGYLFDFVSGPDNYNGDSSSQLNNIVYVDFRWSF